MKLDDLDCKILEILQTHGRITNIQLAQWIGLSPAPTLERVRKLENMGLIQSYHALLNARKLGLNTVIFVEVSLNLHQDSNIEEFFRHVGELEEVVECYHITGDADFLLKIYAPDITAYHTLVVDKLARVPGVGKLQSKVVLKTVKRNDMLPLPDTLFEPPRQNGASENGRSRSRGKRGDKSPGSEILSKPSKS